MFRYDAAIAERYPDLRAGLVHAQHLGNGPSSEALKTEYTLEQRSTIERLAETPIAELPSIKSWRGVFSSFGVKPTQHRVAAEALLRRLNKAGDIPSFSTLVDIGNLVSIRYGLPVAAFDLGKVAVPITVGVASGDESFIDLGSDTAATPAPGEVIFVDEAETVCARRWCWRQSAPSATTPATTEALFVVEAHHDCATEDVAQASQDLVDLLRRHQPDVQIDTRQLPDSESA